MLRQQLHIGLLQRREQWGALATGELVHALTQGLFRGHGADAEGLGEKCVMAVLVDVLEVAVPQAQQPKPGQEDVQIGVAAFRGFVAAPGCLEQVYDIWLLKNMPGKYQSAIGLQIIARIFDVKFFHERTPL